MDRNRLPWRHSEKGTLNFAQHEERVKLKLEAQMLPGLYERLLSMKGFCLRQTYTLHWLFDVGGQGILYLAEDLHHDQMQVLIKMPFLHYHRQAYMTLGMIEQARSGILWEAYILILFPGTILPEFYDFFEDVNPLYDPAWGVEIARREPYLVMEFIRGHSLEEEIHRHHSAQGINYEALESLAWDIAYEVLSFCQGIWEQAQLLYTDLRPQNIMLAHRDDRRSTAGWRRRSRPPEKALPPCKVDTPVRLIDVGSIVKRREDLRMFPYHPAYIPPAFHQSSTGGGFLIPDSSFVIYTLGKTLFQLLTNREPLPAHDPDFGEPVLRNYSTALLNVLHGMIAGDYSTFEEPRSIVGQHLKPCTLTGGSP